MNDCPNQPDLSDMKESVKVLAAETRNLANNLNTFGRYLLIALIIIALGRTGIDIGKELLGKTAAAVQAAEK